MLQLKYCVEYIFEENPVYIEFLDVQPEVKTRKKEISDAPATAIAVA